MRCSAYSRSEFNLVQVPKAVGLNKIKRTNRESKWVSNLLYAMGGEEREEEVLADLLTFFARDVNYCQIWNDVVEQNGSSIPKIDEPTTKAIQSMCNMNITQMRTLRSCLYSELGSPIFASEYKLEQVLDIEFVEPITGVYNFTTSEKISWSYRSIKNCFLLWIKSRQFHLPCNYEKQFLKVDVCVNLDHGKGHSRVSANFIGRYKDSDGKWQSSSYACPLGNAKCKHDNAEVIKNTFGCRLDQDLMEIKNSRVTIRDDKVIMVPINGTPTQQQDHQQQQEDNNNNTTIHDNSPETTIDVELFLAADVLLYAIALGKEGSATWWCPYCDLKRTQWQQYQHATGNLWTLDSLCAHHDVVSVHNTSNSDRDRDARKGVKSKPLFLAIPLSNYIIPILHLTIGKGNNVLKHLVEEMQAAAERYSDKYLSARRGYEQNQYQLQCANEEEKLFLRYNSGYMKELRRLN